MAIDKAIDSAVLEANLKAVADAIREKGGTSDTLAFPSGFADAIAAIESGGGGSLQATGDFSIIGSISGTYTPSKTTHTIDVTVPSGITPKIIFMYPITDVDYSGYGFTDLFQCLFIVTENPYQSAIDEGVSIYISGTISNSGVVSISSNKYRIANVSESAVGLANGRPFYGSYISKESADSIVIRFQRNQAKAGAQYVEQGYSVGTTYQWYAFY